MGGSLDGKVTGGGVGQAGAETAPGFTLLELLLIVLIVGLLGALAIPIVSDMSQRSAVRSVAEDAHNLHGAFLRYKMDVGSFPSTFASPESDFNMQTLSPIYPTYFSQAPLLVQKLVGKAVTLYGSPDTDGPDLQFWVVLTPTAHPDLRVLVAHTDQFPGASGSWLDGIYKIEGRAIVPYGF